MEKYIISKDLHVFGFVVDTFPQGIDEAFQSLVNSVPGGFTRSFYGISKMERDHMIYIAAAEEIEPEEASKNKYQRYCIDKGEYLTVTIRDWRNKTGTINGVFQRMMQDHRIDRSKPCVEWYKDNSEMVCMVKMMT
jgi:hypothetical protein